MKITTLGEDLFKVESERKEGQFYEVQIDPREASCTCPHYIYRCKRAGLQCKHIIAVLQAQEAN